MNDRKQHVIKMAHQLFIDRGFQATSIQDILNFSGISKGTFYNYFSSKNELLIALFKTLYKRLEKDRNELLIGRSPSDIGIFVKQIELQVETNRTNKLITLFEEVLVSNDPDLKQFIKEGQLRMLHWVHRRFMDIFDESKEPYLLDCAIMFMGILHQNLKYYAMVHESTVSIQQVVRYSVERAVKMVNEVAQAGDQLIQPEFLDNWLPDCEKTDQALQQKLCHTILVLKKALNHPEENSRYIELLDFVQDELLHSKNPRKFLIESALFSLKAGQVFFGEKELQKLDQLAASYFT
ncbi:TetR family transcriptional regulator [Bacillus aerolatus]|uniref:TetR family transcriptional regulator n=1 Tax=Bacillus aerolatus TaxID=2653354 RepID=A0A6I1FH29_9BACI|nr:TetR/AcrR family transcriptional regulator [Bacillus aerolatus]KAB7705291.1 TetR family transcriptional regulator [Bacillus aerolatus]